MDTQIFKLGLSVYATSLYILVTELADSGVRPTLEEIGSRFNLGPEETGQALRELLSSKVLYENGAPEIHSFHPNPASLWELPQRG